MQLGPYRLPNNVFVAPMAGVTDRPFRRLCRQLGAGYAVSEMAASNPRLWASVKTSRRLNHDGEAAPVAVQIAGADPAMMAQAALSAPKRCKTAGDPASPKYTGRSFAFPFERPAAHHAADHVERDDQLWRSSAVDMCKAQ